MTEAVAKPSPKGPGKKPKHGVALAIQPDPPLLNSNSKPVKGLKGSPALDTKPGKKIEREKLGGGPEKRLENGGEGDLSSSMAEGKRKKTRISEKESERAKKALAGQETLVGGDEFSNKRKVDEMQIGVAEEAPGGRKMEGKRAKKGASVKDQHPGISSDGSGKNMTKAKIATMLASESEGRAILGKSKSLAKPGKKGSKVTPTSNVAACSPSPDPMPRHDEQQLMDSSDEEGVHLHGFSTDDGDSSDEADAMEDEPSALDVRKLPTIAKDDATVKRKLDKAKRQLVCLAFHYFSYLTILYSSCRPTIPASFILVVYPTGSTKTS
jgi:hypothetical protein